MKNFLLILILVLASVLRLYKLSSYPAGLNADEAALGYNAYSLLLTGKDEHGHPWPVNLESFGDFKPAGYAYLLIPFIKVFGLTEFAVRLPSAVFGILGVLFIYLLTKELINKDCGLIAALMLTISPWHLHFSRGGWEVNVATTLILIGAWLFLKKRFALCTLPFALSMYTYQSARLIVPLMGLGLFFLYRPKRIFMAFVLGFLLLIPLTYNLVTTDAASRLSGVGLLADEGPLNRAKELRGQHPAWSSPLSRILHNRPVLYSIQFLKNYTDHFFGDFLFVNGDVIPRNRVPETGLLYFTDFIFLGLGAVYLLRTMNHEPRTKLVWLWLAIAPIAAALTFQTPHALRAQNMVIPLTIILSFGIYSFFIDLKLKIKNLKLFRLVIGGFVIVYLWQVARYLHEYYVHYPQTYPYAWEYGFKELVAYVGSVQDKYEKILVTDKYDQPYIIFLFYSKYPPQNFQGRHTLTFRDKYNFSTVRDYDKFHFSATPWTKVSDIHSSLIVAAPEDIPDVGVNIVKTINFPNDQPAFKIISN
ncbi:MAG: glycosyltransferase family 39 protein [Patescibacteria group bacterium]